MTMWCSSFAVDDAVNSAIQKTGDSAFDAHDASVSVCGVVWSDDAALTRTKGGKEDVMTTVYTTEIALLRQLRVISGSYVVVSFREKHHVARLVLTSRSEAKSTRETGKTDADRPTIVLTPLLAFNLGVPLHAASGEASASVHLTVRSAQPHEIGLSSALTAPFRRLSEQKPAIASKAVIAPLLVSSLACREHAVMQTPDGLLQAMRSHFTTPQVLQTGDVLAVTLEETYPSTSEADQSVKTSFQTVVIPASLTTGEEGDVTVVLPPALPVDTSLVFFRVESLEADASTPEAPLALSVSSDTELLQTGSVSAAAPDEDAIKSYLSGVKYEDECASSSTMLQSAALDRLYEMLHPSQLCDVPVSVLLSGPRGVGKTTLLHQVAKLLGISVVEVPFTELTAQSELHLLENMREQVAKAQALAPCVLYISHFFAVEKNDEESELRVAAVLTECLKTLSSSSVGGSHNIPLVACVDDISEVPKFIRQCFLYDLAVEAPDQKERHAFLKQLASTTQFDKEVELQELAQRTAGRTCGELCALVTDAGVRAIDRLRRDSSVSLLDRLQQGLLDASSDSCRIAWEDLEGAIKHQQSQSSAAKMGGAASIPNVKWDDVGGLEDVKDEILDVVQLPIMHPELFASGVRQRSGILLYGPPGTGKTLLAKAIATECNMNFMSVKGPELLNMYIGESEKNVRQVFARARSCRPCVLFFDELDSLAPMRGRGSDSGGVMDRVVSQLLTEIDGLSSGGSASGDQVFVIGATNRPDLIESGLLRPGRFDRLLYLGICTEKAAQLKVVQALTRKFTLADDVDLEAVVEHCPTSFTGADFYALCSGALAAALKDRVEQFDQQLEELNAADCYSSSPMTARVLLNRLSPEELAVRVAQEHFLTSLSQVVPSVSPAELLHYEKLRDQYSSRQG
ncbi:hypothetical protein Poli38472_013608 [Pythium oligandrum]|uniref:Peroxisomal ATPase PEX6 n=1 Tax=Pythium oligandrum TaxID=41045 RepID=A0A8K1CE64_PYTOL|nr:hypothetical protein Poli38472_013608 [Pythium oligandrum]|eukprot:TMW61145.1 hypothetical protein Poli38472_013608 [Pythium oligandrum]